MGDAAFHRSPAGLGPSPQRFRTAGFALPGFGHVRLDNRCKSRYGVPEPGGPAAERGSTHRATSVDAAEQSASLNRGVMALNGNSTEEKAKPFRLVKYFTITSLIAIFLGTVTLSFLNVHWAKSMQQKKSEEYARLLIANLNHQVFLQFIIPVAVKYGKIQLRDMEQRQIMDKVVRSTLHGFKVERVNLYDMEHTISYSFDESLIGLKDTGGKGYLDALEGESTSKRVQKGSWLEIQLGFSAEQQLITFAPLRAEKPLYGLSGPVLGVVEIVQDLSEDYGNIIQFQIFVISTSLVVMGILLAILILIVKRGEGIIEQRARERLRLKEKLNRAEHLSALGEMVAGVSHEIRNPLGIIRSSAELLKKKVAAHDPSNTIPDIIVEESNRLNNIITDFLNFARPIPPDLAICRINEIIQKNIGFLATQLDPEKYIIETVFSDPPPQISADPDMLYQAFLNVLINAVQAMPDGGKITISHKADGNTAILAFDDDGGGVPPDLLEKIWDPFFTTKEKGTGLGLGIVKKIITLHGGRITIANRENQGARVEIRLPIETE